MDRNLYALLDTGILRRSDGGETFVFCFLASFAAFWWVLEVLVTKEQLLSGRPDKILAAVDTSNLSILKFPRIVVQSVSRRLFLTGLR